MLSGLKQAGRVGGVYAIPSYLLVVNGLELGGAIAPEWSHRKNLAASIGKATERRLQCSKQSSTQL
jgi:hypothetical protein